MGVGGLVVGPWGKAKYNIPMPSQVFSAHALVNLVEMVADM